MLMEPLLLFAAGVLVYIILAGFIGFSLYSAGLVCSAAFRGHEAAARRRAIPRWHLRQLDTALEEAEQRARHGDAYAGHARLAASLREAREECDPEALWWGPLMTRWQSEVARYERQHGIRPAAEIAPCVAPDDAARLLSPADASEGGRIGR